MFLKPVKLVSVTKHSCLRPPQLLPSTAALDCCPLLPPPPPLRSLPLPLPLFILCLLDYHVLCVGMQGEMIQAKFGLVAVAERQLETYSTAVLLATESPPKPPRSVTHPLPPDASPLHA